MRTLILNQHGQSSVEAAAMALAVVVFTTVFLGVIYLMYSSYWIEHIMYESLICTQEQNTSVCLREANKKISSILIFKNSYNLKIRDYGSRTEAHLKVKIDPPALDAKVIQLKKVLRI